MDDSENGTRHSKRINELEKCLKAIANQSNLQETGVVQPYSVESEVIRYPPKFKAPILQTFDSKGFSN